MYVVYVGVWRALSGAPRSVAGDLGRACLTTWLGQYRADAGLGPVRRVPGCADDSWTWVLYLVRWRLPRR